MKSSYSKAFSGKLVVITGGTSGIGLALAEKLYRCNATIIVLADKQDNIERVAAQFGGRSSKFGAYVCDIGVPDSVREAGKAISASYGVPDILINNAGFTTYRMFAEEPLVDIERLVSVNFAGALRVTKEFLDGMIARGSGQIVNIASVAGTIALTPNGVYSACKHGMVAWSKCVSLEIDRFGLSVTVVCPGRVETGFFDHESFRTRPHRKETEITVSLAAVVDATLDAIAARKFIVFVPRYFGIATWILNAMGPLARWPLDRLLRSRVEDIYSIGPR